MKIKEGDIVIIKNSLQPNYLYKLPQRYHTVNVVGINSDNLICEISTVCKSIIKGSFPEISFKLASKTQIIEFEKEQKKIIYNRVVDKIKGNWKDYDINTQSLIDLIETNNAKGLLPKLLREFKKVGYTAITIGMSDKSVKSSINWGSGIQSNMIFSYPDIYKPEPWPAIWQVCEQFGLSGCGNSQQKQVSFSEKGIKYNWKSIQGVYNLKEK